ncbi:MAG: methylene-tetrahydromethanopterin dehydrogenase N-terminal domain-containing protein [Planctomycetota bacterium]
MSKQKILIQIDGDPHASSFDSIVAIDAGVERLLPYHNVSSMEVQTIVHGAMFTRGVDDLKSTALFFGGSDVEQTSSLFRAAQKCFFGPVRVSMMSDPNGSNTTAVAAVLSAESHIELRGKTVTVLAATGPVGLRVAQLAYAQGGNVRVCSRRRERAASVCAAVKEMYLEEAADNDVLGELVPQETDSPMQTLDAIRGADVMFSAGAAGVELVSDAWQELDSPPRIAIDLNAVPPAGIEGVEVTDKAEERNGTLCYGAIGVGGLKMKIHKQCIRTLFESNDCVLATREIYEIGKKMAGKPVA